MSEEFDGGQSAANPSSGVRQITFPGPQFGNTGIMEAGDSLSPLHPFSMAIREGWERLVRTGECGRWASFILEGRQLDPFALGVGSVTLENRGQRLHVSVSA